jgi:hypothetical protein
VLREVGERFLDLRTRAIRRVMKILESSSSLDNLVATHFLVGACPALCFLNRSSFSLSLEIIASAWMVKRAGTPLVIFFFELRYKPEKCNKNENLISNG